jgi:hypothetical protein
MRRITTITGPDGKVTRITTRSSGCGCLTILAAIVVFFGPAAWFGPWAVPAYVLLGILIVAYVAAWYPSIRKNVRRPTSTPQPPPAPTTPRLLRPPSAPGTVRRPPRHDVRAPDGRRTELQLNPWSTNSWS